MNEEEYVIINKTALLKRIEELEKEKASNLTQNLVGFANQNEGEIIALKQILSQSTPLIPEIEKAYDEGFNSEEEIYKGNPTGKIIGKKEYLENLKFDLLNKEN